MRRATVTPCVNCGRPGPHFIGPSLGDKGFFACDSLNDLTDYPMPTPPQCDHPERPHGKPMCHACYGEYKPKFDEWAAQRKARINARRSA